jgi:hypothetical protein
LLAGEPLGSTIGAAVAGVKEEVGLQEVVDCDLDCLEAMLMKILDELHSLLSPVNLTYFLSQKSRLINGDLMKMANLRTEDSPN